MLFFGKKKPEKDFDTEFNVAFNATLNERFSQAAAEYFSSLPDLVKISHHKLNPNYLDANLSQQAGFSAEIRHVAHTNANNIISGSSVRINLTDRLGSRNDPLADYVCVGADNKPLKNPDGSYVKATQSKFLKDPKSYDKLLSEKWYGKYQTAQIDVPSDHYPAVIQHWNEEIDELTKQESHLKKSASPEELKKVQQRIKRIKDLKSRINASSLSSDEAKDARINPRIVTFKDVGKVSHAAGVEGAKYGASFGAGISGAQNLIRYRKGEISFEEASANTVKQALKSGASGYVNSAATTALSGAMKASQQKVLQSLAQKGGPAAIVQAGAVLSKNVILLAQGKVSAEQFVGNVGKEGLTLGASLSGSSIGAIVGTAIFPGIGTAIGGVVGGMAYSLMMQAGIGQLQQVARETTLAFEHRNQVEKITRMLIEQEREYRRNTLDVLATIIDSNEKELLAHFETTLTALRQGTDLTPGLQSISQTMKLNINFPSKREIETKLNSGQVIRI
jgi:flagellar biosynthesis chaperone FliJ